MLKVYTQYNDFMPGFKKEQELYDNTVVRGYDHHSRQKTEGPWPRIEVPTEVVYKEFMKTISDKKAKTFNSQKDVHGIPVKGTGATHTINTIVRVRTPEGEFLYTKRKDYRL